MTCCFFGHKDTPSSVYPKLRNTVEDIIVNHGVSEFLIGNQGTFDRMVLKVLREMKQVYPHICYHVVLAYMPQGNQVSELYTTTETFLPEGIEVVPKRFAIPWRNKWMVRESQIVVCYIVRSWGGAAQFVEYAGKCDKEIVNLAENHE